jgi:hypothetical protein
MNWKQMGNLQLPRIFNQPGDTIVGEKITIEAQLIEMDRLDTKTSKHRGQFAVARRSARAMIDFPRRYVFEQKDGKSKRGKR